MITVKNLTKQGREVIFFDSDEYIHYWLPAAAVVSVPDDFITDTVREAARRKILKFSRPTKK
tara:strand:+ start:999 stop:1184 length:186 start_codon:yes stop_codon:yes gene_type:complete